MENQDNYWKRKQLSRRQVLKSGLVFGAGVVGLTVAGCTSNAQSPTPTATVKPAGGTTPVAAATSAPVAVATPTAVKKVPTGKVTLATATLGAENIDPLEYVGGVELTHVNAMYETLVARDLQGKIVPGLATSWSNREGGQIWDFTLRKGVKFHNGDTMTAKDVKFSFDKMLKAKGTAAAMIAGYLDSVEIVDDYKVTVKLKKKMGPFITAIDAGSFIVPKDYFEKVGAEGFVKNPVGTGPFRLVKRTLNESMEFEAFEESWRQVPNIKTLVIRVIPEFATRINMLKAKEVDIAGGIIASSMQEVTSTSGLRLLINKETSESWIWFVDQSKMDGTNYVARTGSPFLDKRVRQAANYAVDREAIAQKLYQGQASAMVTITMPSYFGFDSSLKPYPYDPAKAKALLKEAGYADGFTTDLYTSEQAAIPFTVEMGQAVGGYLNAVGIKTNVNKLEYGTHLAKVKSRDLQGLHVISTIAQYDAWRPLALYSKTGPWSMTADPEMDKLIASIEDEGDESKREALSKQAVRKEYEDAQHLFVLYGHVIYGVSDRVADWPQQVGFGYPKWYELLKLKG